MKINFSNNVLKHIFTKHRGFTKILRISTLEDLRKLIMDVVDNPDEIYRDKYNVNYFLRKINNLWINIIIVGDTVKTAYIIGLNTYKRFREKKWL